MNCKDCGHDSSLHTDAGCTQEPFCGCRTGRESILVDAIRDPLIEKAKSESSEIGFVSVSNIQRKLRVGYTRAARLVDWLIEDGFCEPERNGEYRYEIKRGES